MTEHIIARGTIAVAAVATAQAVGTRNAVAATRDDVREASPARVDGAAPRITGMPSAINSPPHPADSSDWTRRLPLIPKERLLLANDDGRDIYGGGIETVTNEGSATAVLSIPGTPSPSRRARPGRSKMMTLLAGCN